MEEIEKLPCDLHSIIPGGAHTYSRGDDTFPSNAPRMLTRGRGAYVWGEDNSRYIDWGMALRSVSIGHHNLRVDRAVGKAIRRGVNMSRPIPEELELASLLRAIVPGAQMVKFGKNGSDATAAAVRLARSFTGRDLVARCEDSDFISIQDWFIGSTAMDAGVPLPVRSLTLTFPYGSVDAVETLFAENPGRIAALVLEPIGNRSETNADFLNQLIGICHREGALVIFDETVSGFRVSPGGAQELLGVEADMATFGKAIANGYALSALTGKQEILERGGIRHAHKRTFLMSSTYGSERVGLAAGIATVEQLRDGTVIRENLAVMTELVAKIRNSFKAEGIDNHLRITGLPVSPNISFVNEEGNPDFAIKTLFMQCMIEEGILLSQHLFSIAACHRGRVVKRTLGAIEKVSNSLASSIRKNIVKTEIRGDIVKPVFRVYNADAS